MLDAPLIFSLPYRRKYEYHVIRQMKPSLDNLKILSCSLACRVRPMGTVLCEEYLHAISYSYNTVSGLKP